MCGTRGNSHEIGYRDYQMPGQIDDVKECGFNSKAKGRVGEPCKS